MTSTTTDVIDGVSGSTAIKAPVRCATTANITLSGFQTIDAIVLASSDENLRVLVKDQTDTTENGIYNAASGAWTRAADFDGNRDVKTGTLIFVQFGTTNAETMWRVTTADPVVIDTSSISFESALINDSSVISFLQAGSGAVARSVQSKLRDTICVKDFAAAGDGVADDGAEIQAAIDAANSAGGGIVLCEPGKTYLTATTVVLKANVALDLNRSTLKFRFAAGADAYGLDIRDYSQVYNGTVEVAALGNPTSVDGGLHASVIVGDSGGNLAHYTGWRISDLIIKNNRSDTVGGTGIYVQAGCSNGIIENIEFPDSTTIRSCVSIRWTGPGGSPPATTEHPHNIAVRNIKIGSMTKTGVVFDIAAIDLFGCYNVVVDNVRAKRWAGDALVQVRAGGFGNTAAPTEIKPLLFRGIHVKNVSAELCDQHLVVVNGKANDAVGTPLMSMPVVIENVKGVGPGASSTLAGIRINNSYDVRIIECEAEQFDRGLYIEEGAERIYVHRGRYFKNNESGVMVVHATTPKDIIFDQVESYLNGQDGGSHAGFYADSCSRVQFINCISGHASSETTQLYGFRVTSSGADTKFSGRNRVRNIKGGGTKYLFAAAVYGDRQFSGGSNAALSTTNTEYAPVSGIGLAAADADATVITSTDLVLTNFQVKLSAAPNGATKSRGIRILDDGAATALEVTIVDAATTGSDVEAVEVAANSELSVQSLVTNTPDAARGKWSVEAFQI